VTRDKRPTRGPNPMGQVAHRERPGRDLRSVNAHLPVDRSTATMVAVRKGVRARVAHWN
jgi:hypothetical protein